MSKFKVGDRVRTYSGCMEETGEITDIIGDQIRVMRDCGGPIVVYHEKQCRKLKPKRKPREWWIDFNASVGVGYTTSITGSVCHPLVQSKRPPQDTNGYILVREVLKK